MDPHDALTLQMLRWIATGSHSYAEVLEVWKSSCPRLSIWEDACADGLIDAAPGMSGLVSLSEKGSDFLSRSQTHACPATLESRAGTQAEAETDREALQAGVSL